MNFQTADAFVKFILERKKPKKLIKFNYIENFLYKIKFFSLINKFFPKFNITKRFWLYSLKGFTNSEINELATDFFLNVLQKNINNKILNLLEKYIINNNEIVLISGGYEPYLKVFCKHYHIDSYFGTKIQFLNGYATGKIDGYDCLGKAKSVILQKILNRNSQYKDIIVISDSNTDMPIFNMATIPIVVSTKKEQDWVKENNFNEIVLRD